MTATKIGLLNRNILAQFTGSVGDAYQGSTVYYPFQEGDAGYVAGEIHGLIAATEDQPNDGNIWSNGVVERVVGDTE